MLNKSTRSNTLPAQTGIQRYFLQLSTKPWCHTFLLWGLLLTITTSTEGQTHAYIVRTISGGQLIYEVYDSGGTHTIDVSDMTIWDGIKGNTDVYNSFYYSGAFREILLRNGYAKLNFTNKATADEIAAQEEARSANKGIWAPSTPPPPPPPPPPFDWNKFWAWTQEILRDSFITALLFAVIRWLYINIYLKRQVDLLVIGQPDCGKTALCLVLEKPNTPKADILKLEHSKAVSTSRTPERIPRGKFEILPAMTDVPGTDFSTAWNKIHGTIWGKMLGLIRKYALVVVLAPGERNGTNGGTVVSTRDVSSGNDQAYLYRQLGYIEAFVGGSLGSKKARKPRVVVLFMNKFDWFARMNPNDSSSLEVRRQFLAIFEKHIDLIKSAATKQKIPFESIVGSAVEKWGTEEVLDAVVHQLYKA